MGQPYQFTQADIDSFTPAAEFILRMKPIIAERLRAKKGCGSDAVPVEPLPPLRRVDRVDSKFRE
jgi:hypothetical protein